jgi:hypothetical protein
MAIKVLAKRGTESQIAGTSAESQIQGEIAFATDDKDFYVSDGSNFIRIGGEAPVGSFDMKSQDGSVFTIVVTNAGSLLVVPEGSIAPTITVNPTISGTEKVWYTLTATAGTTSGSPTPTRSFQWQSSSNGTDWSDISGETNATIVLTSTQANNYVRVQQIETNVLGSATAVSASTGLIVASIFSTTQYQNILPITWEALTEQTWN